MPLPPRTDGGAAEEHDYDFDAPGVPDGEGESFGELAARIRGEYEANAVSPEPDRSRDYDSMDRTTLRLPKGMLARLDSYVEVGRYPNRSAAVRAGIRRLIDDEPAWFEQHRRDVS